jgi:hypothetical protein
MNYDVLRGYAIYMIFYIFIGLVNRGILFLSSKFLGLKFALILMLVLVFPTVFLLYYAFYFSLTLFADKNLKRNKVLLACVLQMLVFSIFSFTFQQIVVNLITAEKLAKIIVVLGDALIFGITYIVFANFAVRHEENTA